jgi:hypothetical protein
MTEEIALTLIIFKISEENLPNTIINLKNVPIGIFQIEYNV